MDGCAIAVAAPVRMRNEEWDKVKAKVLVLWVLWGGRMLADPIERQLTNRIFGGSLVRKADQRLP